MSHFITIDRTKVYGISHALKHLLYKKLEVLLCSLQLYLTKRNQKKKQYLRNIRKG